MENLELQLASKTPFLYVILYTYLGIHYLIGTSLTLTKFEFFPMDQGDLNIPNLSGMRKSEQIKTQQT